MDTRDLLLHNQKKKIQTSSFEGLPSIKYFTRPKENQLGENEEMIFVLTSFQNINQRG